MIPYAAICYTICHDSIYTWISPVYLHVTPIQRRYKTACFKMQARNTSTPQQEDHARSPLRLSLSLSAWRSVRGSASSEGSVASTSPRLSSATPRSNAMDRRCGPGRDQRVCPVRCCGGWGFQLPVAMGRFWGGPAAVGDG